MLRRHGNSTALTSRTWTWTLESLLNVQCIWHNCSSNFRERARPFGVNGWEWCMLMKSISFLDILWTRHWTIVNEKETWAERWCRRWAISLELGKFPYYAHSDSEFSLKFSFLVPFLNSPTGILRSMVKSLYFLNFY